MIIAPQKTVYAMYKGERLIATGTVDQLAKIRGVRKQTIYNYSKPYHIKMAGPDSTVVHKIGKADEFGLESQRQVNVYRVEKAGVWEFTGTAKEIAEYKGVSENAVYIMSSPSYKAKDRGNHTIITKIGTTDDVEGY